MGEGGVCDVNRTGVAIQAVQASGMNQFSYSVMVRGFCVVIQWSDFLGVVIVQAARLMIYMFRGRMIRRILKSIQNQRLERH
jgi:hypothetical protein